MTANVQLMRDAKASLRGHWGSAALAYLIVSIIIGAASLTYIGSIIIGGPMVLGFVFYLRAIRSGESPGMEVLFSGFKDFMRSFLTCLLVNIFVLLWTLLLVIPGFIMSYAYSMAMFIVADDPEVSAMDAIRRSRNMMKGYKWKLFCLHIRFLGWLLLSILTFGILLFWIVPYMCMATLNFYHDVKVDWEARQSAAQ